MEKVPGLCFVDRRRTSKQTGGIVQALVWQGGGMVEPVEVAAKADATTTSVSASTVATTIAPPLPPAGTRIPLKTLPPQRRE